ncbi:Fatty acyl-CoA reductase 1 [Armadillidium nasatum]|uniref:Fatty acyl-CoA reductase 1 n=1 Tax=Armadillidium nasatum TaxID=96803 RepID=A0A5N5SK92_9CRUS|nr:Fatty acyl-CoA reductase 1 [Armadillidium nasatum]
MRESFNLGNLSRFHNKNILLRRVMRKIEKSQSVSDYFLKNDFTFCNKNVKEIWKNLSVEDQEEFCFDVSRISWNKYFEKYCLGCKQYVVNEDLSTLPQARFQMRIMKFIYYFLTWSVILGVFYACFPQLRNSYSDNLQVIL